MTGRDDGEPPAWMADLFVAVASCAGPFMRQRRALVSQTLLETAREPKAAFAPDDTLCALMRALLGELQSATRGPLPPSGASVLLPLLRRSLSFEAKGEVLAGVHEAAFAALCAHCVPQLALTLSQVSVHSAGAKHVPSPEHSASPAQVPHTSPQPSPPHSHTPQLGVHSPSPSESLQPLKPSTTRDNRATRQASILISYLHGERATV